MEKVTMALEEAANPVPMAMPIAIKVVFVGERNGCRDNLVDPGMWLYWLLGKVTTYTGSHVARGPWDWGWGLGRVQSTLVRAKVATRRDFGKSMLGTGPGGARRLRGNGTACSGATPG